MQWLAEICVKRPVFAWVLVLSLTVVGLYAFGQLGVDRFPNVDIPSVLVTTRLPGAAPEQVETEITDKIEESVNTISGIDQLTSTSSEGISQVVVSFKLEKNTDVAAQEVRDRVNRALPLLPRTVTQPTVEKLDPTASPVITVAITANKPLRDITEYADKGLRRWLESVDGVGQVLVIGGRKRQINVWLDAEQLSAQGMSVNEVGRALQAQNADIPGGRIDRGAQSVTLRTRGRVESVADFGDIVLREVGGHPVQLHDVARIEDGMAEAMTQASVNGVPTVLLQIRKQSGTNTVAVANSIKQRLVAIRASLPPGYELRIVRDEAQFIEASIAAVQEHLVVGSILAAAVVLLFLGNLRSTVIAAIAIPTSIVATFALIWYMGFTLNMLTMLALTLSVGIVIDDAIVVLENIYRFIEEKGMSPMEAAIEATREIGLAVMATTLSLVAIFAPIGFMSGIVGRFMASFGLTMAFAVLVSLFVSFTLTPMMSAHWLKAPPKRDGNHDSKHSVVFGPFDRVYSRMLRWSMAHRGSVAMGTILVLLSSVPLFRITAVTFTPQDDTSQFDITLRAPEGTSLAGTDVLANRVATAVRKLPEVDFTLVTVAGDTAGTLNTATVFVRLKEIGDRSRDQFAVMADVRTKILPAALPENVRVAVQFTGGPGGGGGDIQFLVQGPDLKALERYSEALRTTVKRIPGLVDVDTTLNAGKPELSVYLDRPKAADLGVPIADAAEALRLLVGGDQVTTYNEGGEQYEVHLRAEDRNRGSEAAITALPVPSTRLGIVTLDNIARLAPGDAPATISRNARQRQVTLTANMVPGTSQAVVQQQIAEAARGLGMPPEYRADFAGRSRELNRTATAFLTAIVLSLAFMYLILAAQFESWLHPVTILLSLPLTLPFALISIIVFQQSLNIFSGLGLLVLFGVVKKNSILQIDHANQLRDAGMNTHDAVIQASRDRLRPILMTTIAFVAGMIPLVITRGAGAATNHAIGWAVIGGQTLVLLVTLLVTPVAYSLFDELEPRRILRKSVGWLRSKLPAADPITPV
ncbi:MAG TPA: efflux RND transporter permease subunit [Vicinamibacterales bacterium]|nr:efflux RND transporter permease subunit [Vicinamibacterales bacterium]